MANALSALGWGDRVAERYAAVAAEGCVPGRIVRVERASGLAATADGVISARAPAPIAVGDWVTLRGVGDGEATIVAVMDRWSQLTRRDPEGSTQVLAANVDNVFVTAPADRLSASRVEREIAMAWDSGALPIVLVTKCDLAEPGVVDELHAVLLGVDVVGTSVVTGEGLEQVALALQPARTAVLLGPSGAGKSSIVNWLLGEERMETGSVRASDRRGRHTTNVRQLLVVPTGGCLIDTPGLRSLSLAADHGGVAAAFPDIEDLAPACRFADCQHEHEPGCAVLAAVEGGMLDPRRLANYRKLERELAFEARRDDPLARAAAEQVWKTRAKQARQGRHDRG
jgi:ribosome biogenesis GTPase